MVAQYCSILQNALLKCFLEAGAATTIAPTMKPTFARNSVALVFAGVSIELYGQGAPIFNTSYGGTGKLAEYQMNAARAMDFGAGGSTISVANVQAADGSLKIVPLLLFILGLKAHWIGIDM